MILKTSVIIYLLESKKNMSESIVNNTFDWIKWEKKFELGIPEIDSHHKHLVELCNTLHKDLLVHNENIKRDVPWQITLSGVLRELADYTKYHFDFEEKYMQVANFSGYAEHKKRHKEFIAKVTDILKTFDKATVKTAFEVANFLRDWILSHVAYEDSLYVSTISSYIENDRNNS